MQIQNEALFQHSLSEGINLFLGAGFSVLAEGADKKIPVGDGLKEELLDHFKRKKPSSLNLAQLCHIISSTNKDGLINYFKERFTVTHFDPAYKELEKANIKAIFTTNIDDLIFKIFKDSEKHYINDIQLRGPVISGSSAIDYIALHGSVAYPDADFAFSPIEIAASFERDKDKWFGYIGRIQTTPTLYWGYRVEDAGVLQALAKESSNGRKKADAWIVLRKSDEEAIEYYSSLGFQIIISDTKELLNYIGKHTLTATSHQNQEDLGHAFREYNIPPLTTVPVRSLTEFFLGAEPIWYDIYSGKLHETSHFAAAKNAIIGSKHVILIGGPVTGKSTLLKQLAIGLTGLGTPLYVNEITPEKAQLLTREIDRTNTRSLIFIDNAADAAEAIQTFIKSKNIKVVATERDYIFDSVSHKFPPRIFKLLDVSGLSDIDTQAIQNSIPNDVKRKVFTQTEDQLASGAEPTFFDVITSTITENSLADRFISAIKTMKQSMPNEHDVLLMACYLHACRVPTSVDIASAFVRNFDLSAMDAFNILDSMGSLLSPYEGALADSAQAFYVPRSRAVAEVVMNRVPAHDLRRMLEMFHTEVSPTKISRYDIFRRTAYDARTISRAFPKWEDGLAFYNAAFRRDPTHSLKQQGALYLSQKKNYELAFSWIDEARGMTGHNNPTIRNSYAVILFAANYDKMANTEVLATLDESMEILQKCYDDDYRKVYHAKIFAEQAIKYSKRFPDSNKLPSYLEKSQSWLESELKNRPGDRWMRNLLRQIKKLNK